MSNHQFFDERGKYVLPPMPDDLPGIIEYKLGSNMHCYALPRRPVEFVGSNGQTNAAEICPRIPWGCTGWRVPPDNDWRPLSELPEAWLPFLNRRKGTRHDPRRHVGD